MGKLIEKLMERVRLNLKVVKACKSSWLDHGKAQSLWHGDMVGDIKALA